ncbi:MAG: glycosyltransferase family 4 protein [Hyphomicrobiaceae bacterium]|nr:glycosyltransferase family 4 protein [Hyphomicrobiaceae bacterium]
MRLAIFTAQIAPYHNARYIGAMKYFREVHVISTLNAGEFVQFLATDVGYYAVHRIYDGREAYDAGARTGELANRIREKLSTIRPDAIAASGWTAPENLVALAHGREHRIPVIVMSESQSDDAPRSLLRELVKRKVVSQFDAALVGGSPHAEYVARLGIDRKRIHFGYNAVDNDHFCRGAGVARASADATRLKHGLPKSYLLASARFVTKKNLPNLIAAYCAARREVADAPDLVILGDGPERASIESAIVAGGDSRHVHLPGFRGYEDLPEFYGLAEAFAHVSTVEQWGLVINEAMAAGVPVIVSNRCGAARSVVDHGVSGILTGTEVSEITRSLLQFLKLTPRERAAMGRAAASAIADWGPDRFGTGLKRAVESALSIPRRGPIAPWDSIILRYLQTKVLDAVA